MTTTAQTSQEKVRLFDSPVMQEKVRQLSERALGDFFSLTQATRRFNLGFFVLCGLELIAILLLSYLSKPLFIAICLAALCLTIFSYFLLSFYVNAKKPDQMAEMQTDYLSACKGLAEEEDSLLMACLLRHLADLLELKKWTLSSPAPFAFLQPIYEKCLIWMHWKEIQQMKEMLLIEAIGYHLNLVKDEPVDLEAHASLAHAYLALAKLYRSPTDLSWIPAAYSSNEMHEKFEACTARAIQEFKILDSLAPNDPWVHAQLASIYHELGMLDEEVQEHEALLNLSPQDRELQFRLGVLYFRQGETAKALLLYEQLKNSNDKRAPELISYYDACPLFPFSDL